MTRRLRISDDVALPLDAATWTFALLAMRGAGKSNVAVVLVEEMHAAGLHWVAIDPKGDWWGIRSGADGQDAGGLAVPIFGGRHGDVPLEPTAGALLAEMVVRDGVSGVLDVSEMTKNEQIRFLAGSGSEDGFFGRLFRLKDVDQPPTHVVLEEADEYLPQTVTSSVAKLHNDAQRIATKGRQRGLGSTLASQRSARVHKDVLTQTDVLLALRTTGPQDRKAIEAWVDYHGQSDEIVRSLPSLEDGEGWVVAPNKIGQPQRVRFRRRSTFDSGATPKVAAGRRVAPTLADLDLRAIRAQMAETIERARNDDPKELRKRIRDLERQIAERPAAEPEIREVEVLVPTVPRETLDAIHRAENKAENVAAMLETILTEIRTGLAAAGDAPIGEKLRSPARYAPDARAASSPAREPASAPERSSGPPQRVESADDSDALGDYALGLLETLARRHPARVTRGQLAILAGRKPRSSSFRVALAEIIRRRLVDQTSAGLGLTAAGQDLAGDPGPAASPRETWLAALSDYDAHILRTLLDRYPDGIARADVAEAVGVSAKSSSLRTGLSTLVRNELVVVENGSIRPSADLLS